jgi:L-asparagine oxygenase
MLLSVAARHVYSLSGTERARLWDIASKIPPGYIGRSQSPLAQTMDMPAKLTRAVLDFADEPNSAGILLLRGLRVGHVPETPTAHGHAASAPMTSRNTLALVADLLGLLVGYQDEKDGALVHDVHPVRGEERRIENSGSVAFDFHTENVHHPLRPDFLGLLCVRQDHDAVAATRVASAREAVAHLDEDQVRALREPRFRSLYPTSFTRGRQGERPMSAPHPVLFGPWEHPLMRFNTHNTVASDERGRAAAEALAAALERVALDIVLAPGDLILIDNHAVAHGRSSFTPRYDGKDRWLQRCYCLRSLPSWTRRMMRAPRVLPPMTELQGIV